jgi:cell division protein FtsX
MRRVWAVLFLLVIFAVGLGFYRGWFAVSRPASDTGSNEVNITLSADPDKMKQDAQAVQDKAAGLTGGATADDKAGSQVEDQANDDDVVESRDR